MSNRYSISIVVLTFNRRDCLEELLRELSSLTSNVVEIIVVDNASVDGTESVASEFPQIVYLRNETNLGACGRNRGLREARGDIIVTLDDDVFGLDLPSLEIISRCFVEQSSLGVLNFRVLDYFTGALCNWVHHRPSTSAFASFLTYEITEGAVAFRSSALREVGYYWEPFFIGQEGVDLAFRLMDAGFDVQYDGRIVVKHKHEQKARVNWRFYYYDTRNQILLAIRRMRWLMGAKYLMIGIPAMAVYSIRDGFLKWWFKGVFDAIREVKSTWRTRRPMLKRTEALVRTIDKERPSFWAQARKRLFEPANRLEG